MLKVEQAIRDYLPYVLHMSLATCAGDKPWVCEVHFAYDDDLNLYFRSKPSRRHSQEIAQNPNVAGNIVMQHGMSDKPRAVYFEGTAQLLQDVNENDIAFKVIRDRFDKGTEVLEEAMQGGGQFYKIIVADYYLFDARESDPAQKYHLSWKSKQANR